MSKDAAEWALSRLALAPPVGLGLDRRSPRSRYASTIAWPVGWVFPSCRQAGLFPWAFGFGSGVASAIIAPWGAMGEGKAQRPIERFVEPMGGLIPYLFLPLPWA